MCKYVYVYLYTVKSPKYNNLFYSFWFLFSLSLENHTLSFRHNSLSELLLLPKDFQVIIWETQGLQTGKGRKEQKFSKTSLEAVEKWCSSIQNVKTVVGIHLSQILETVFINLLIYVCIISNPVLNWDSLTSKFKGFFFPPCLLNLERIEKFSSFPII